MRAEEEQHLVALRQGEPVQPFQHGLGHRLDESVVHRPAVDDAPLEGVPQSGLRTGAPELVETRTRRAAGELGVLGEGDRTLHTVGLHGAERVLALRTHVAEGDVELVRRGFG